VANRPVKRRQYGLILKMSSIMPTIVRMKAPKKIAIKYLSKCKKINRT
jgi:hypothetical protein